MSVYQPGVTPGLVAFRDQVVRIPCTWFDMACWQSFLTPFINGSSSPQHHLVILDLLGGNVMPPSNPASDLIRMMELRIERQQASVKRLKQAGEETSPAMQKLTLLLRALDEMRFQLNQRAATSTDET
jgi:hypothetical protein